MPCVWERVSTQLANLKQLIQTERGNNAADGERLKAVTAWKGKKKKVPQPCLEVLCGHDPVS